MKLVTPLYERHNIIVISHHNHMHVRTNILPDNHYTEWDCQRELPTYKSFLERITSLWIETLLFLHPYSGVYWELHLCFLQTTTQQRAGILQSHRKAYLYLASIQFTSYNTQLLHCTSEAFIKKLVYILPST